MVLFLTVFIFHDLISSFDVKVTTSLNIKKDWIIKYKRNNEGKTWFFAYEANLKAIGG